MAPSERTDRPFDRSDEHRHDPTDDPWWSESWHLDFWNADASLGGYVRLTLLPAHGRSWFWAALVGDGRPLVTVIDHEAPLPSAGLELRTTGLWTDLIVQTEGEHMTVGLEAFGVAMDDPTEVFGRGWGDREALGLDLEWETADDGAPAALSAGPPMSGAAPASHYEIPTTVHGEILVGAERIDFDGFGSRSHSWGGPPEPPLGGWSATGRLDGGVRFAHAGPGREGTDALVATEDDLLAGATLRPGPTSLTGSLEFEPVAHAPVAVPRAVDAVVPLCRSLCRVTSGGGERGVGWFSTS